MQQLSPMVNYDNIQSSSNIYKSMEIKDNSNNKS